MNVEQAKTVAEHMTELQELVHDGEVVASATQSAPHPGAFFVAHTQYTLRP